MRLPDWDARLIRWAAGAIGRPFAWGSTDCALLAFEAYEAMVGGDLASRHRGKWSDAIGADAFQRAHDTDLERTLRACGCIDVVHGFQQRGDFILFSAAPFVGSWICLGRDSIGAPLNQPVRTVRTSAALTLPDVRILRAP